VDKKYLFISFLGLVWNKAKDNKKIERIIHKTINEHSQFIVLNSDHTCPGIRNFPDSGQIL